MNQDKEKSLLSSIVYWSLMAAVFLVPMYFAWAQENYTVFDLNKSVALRAALTVAICAIITLFALQGNYFSLKKFLAIKVALILALSFLISSLLSLHPIISLLGSYERQQGFHNLIAYIVFFVLLIISLRTERRFKNMLVVAMLSASFVCLYGLTQLFDLDFLNWAESAVVRIFSTFGQPNFLGHYLAVMLPITMYGIVYIARRWWWRASLALLLLAEIVCLIFTYSRAAWLATLVAFCVVALVYIWHIGYKRVVITLCIIGIAGITLIAAPGPRNVLLQYTDHNGMSVTARVFSVLDFQAGSNIIRLKYWGAAWKAFAEAPLYRKLIGFGPDVQATVFVKQYQPDWAYYERINSFPDRAHNVPMDTLLQFGLIGTALALWLLVICVRLLFSGLSKVRGEEYWLRLSIIAAIIIYIVNNLFSFSLTAMAMMWYLLLASAWLVGHRFPKLEWKHTTFFQPLSRWAISITFVILLLVVFFGYNIRPLVADYYYMQVKKAEARQSCRAVLDNMEKVMEWYPISHYYARAYFFHATNCFSAVDSSVSQRQLANNMLEQAKSLNPKENQFYTLIDLSHAYSIMGYYIDRSYFDTAEQYYKELIEQSKFITINYQDYGRMKLWQGKAAEARQLFTQGLAVMPPLDKAAAGSGHTTAIAKQIAYFHDLIGLSYYNERDFTKSAQEYKIALSIDPTLTSSYKQLADIAYQLGRRDEAITYNEQAFAIDPNNSLWPVGLAVLYSEKKDYKKALHYAELAKELDPESDKVVKILEEIKAKLK